MSLSYSPAVAGVSLNPNVTDNRRAPKSSMGAGWGETLSLTVVSIHHQLSMLILRLLGVQTRICRPLVGFNHAG